MATSDFLETLELSVKTSNLLRAHSVTTDKQFLALTKLDVQKMGGLVKSWREIEELRPFVIEQRKQRRRQTVLARVCFALQELNSLKAGITAQGLFITKDKSGYYRIGRYLNREDFKELTDD